MYKQFYSLKRSPFEITPDPSFLFVTKRHNEALAALYYGVLRRRGFVVLTGEVGTGKTLLVRCLLKLLSRNNIHYAYTFSSRLTPMEFLQFIAGDLGLPTAGKTKSELLLELSTFVVSSHEKGATTLLVVDEAHHLATDVLEEIRLLTNLETAEEKLLQILLVGQPELDDKLDSRDLRQLKQRIVLRTQLTPLNLEETKGYIYRRMQLAGSSDPDLVFPADTVSAIHQYSQGIPRLINTLCEGALIGAYAGQTRIVVPEIIDEIARELRLQVAQGVLAEPIGNGNGNGHGEPLSGLEQAMRSLLELSARMRAQSSSNESRTLRETGTSKT
jgi:general secretion pathway protein A